MKTLQLDNATALKIYPSAIPELKAVLEQSFTKEFFSQKITDRVKSFEDALAVKGFEASDVFTDDDTVDEIAYKKIKFVIGTLNEGWKPDFSNKSEAKYHIWWEYKKEKSGFVYYGYDCYDPTSGVGSRLCFRSRELAEHFGKYFADLWNEFAN